MADPEQGPVPTRLLPPSKVIVSLTDAIGDEHLIDQEASGAGGWPPHSAANAPRPCPAASSLRSAR